MSKGRVAMAVSTAVAASTVASPAAPTAVAAAPPPLQMLPEWKPQRSFSLRVVAAAPVAAAVAVTPVASAAWP